MTELQARVQDVHDIIENSRNRDYVLCNIDRQALLALCREAILAQRQERNRCAEIVSKRMLGRSRVVAEAIIAEINNA